MSAKDKPKMTQTKDERLAQAIATADSMAIRMNEQLTRQKAGLDRLLAERQEVIELLQLSLGLKDAEDYVRLALQKMHVKPKT